VLSAAELGETPSSYRSSLQLKLSSACAARDQAFPTIPQAGWSIYVQPGCYSAPSQGSCGSDASNANHPPEEMVLKPRRQIRRLGLPGAGLLVGFGQRDRSRIRDLYETPVIGRSSSYSGRDWRHRHCRRLCSDEGPLMYTRVWQDGSVDGRNDSKASGRRECHSPNSTMRCASRERDYAHSAGGSALIADCLISLGAAP
jgi:hypothetical protein